MFLYGETLAHGYYSSAHIYGGKGFQSASAGLSWRPSQVNWITIVAYLDDVALDAMVDALTIDKGNCYFGYDYTGELGPQPSDLPVTGVQIGPAPAVPLLLTNLAVSQLATNLPELQKARADMFEGFHSQQLAGR